MPRQKTANQAKPKQKDSLSTYLDLNDITLTKNQKIFYNKILEYDKSIIIGSGPAGTAKTFTACYAALKLLQMDKIQNIILTKPIEESGEKLGFLPGEYSEKIAPYYESFIANLTKMIDSKTLGYLIQNGVIKQKVVAYMRGVTFDNSIILVDEAQNMDFRQLMLITTRLGNNSKIVFTGDITQYDIEQKLVHLPLFTEMILDVKGVTSHEFNNSDIVRNKILIEITDRYEKLKAEGKIINKKK